MQGRGLWPVRIDIQARKENQMLYIQVANSGEWMKKSSSTGTGLANLRRRLQLLYGTAAELTFDLNNHQVTANVKLPATEGETVP